MVGLRSTGLPESGPTESSAPESYSTCRLYFRKVETLYGPGVTGVIGVCTHFLSYRYCVLKGILTKCIPSDHSLVDVGFTAQNSDFFII